MALIKTDSQNYTDIANAIRELTGGIKTVFNEDITTVQTSQGIHVNSGLEYIINNYLQRVGEVFEVIYDNILYKCELKTQKQYALTDFITCYYLGNAAVMDYSGNLGYKDTGEPFGIYNILYPDGDTSTSYIYTSEAGTHHFTITENYYKPSQMKDALDAYCPDYGISYSSDGTIATTYGYKAIGCTGSTTLTTVNFSPRTTEIGSYAFANTSSLKNIVIPEGVKKIGYGAFRETSIVSVTLPESLNEIGDYAFTDSSSYFTTINMPNNITKIGSYAFDGCTKVKISSLPENIVEIGACAFFNCQAITISSVPKSLKSLGSSVFVGCYGITNFTFHEDFEELGYTPFRGCKNLTTVTFKGKTKIYKNSFNECDRLTTINVPWSEGEVADAPWGATKATINYNYVG